MRHRLPTSIAAFAFMALSAVPALAQQASITLTNCDAKPCYVHDNTWDVSKEVTANSIVDGVGKVTWTVTATKDASSAPTYSVHGGVTVTNTGSAPATIGNIVVNLQKPNSPKKGSNASHVSIAANVADATTGDAATSAKIVAAGSQENAGTNAAWGTNNYSVSGTQGTFTESRCSGTLNFTDASNNTVFSLLPQPTIAVGSSVTFLYEATFNTACLPTAGTAMRVETLVTFGNSGARGGSGATASSIDINGNGSLGSDEAKVRTVPCRVSFVQPAVEEANGTVTLDDTVSTTGTVTTANLEDNVPATTSASGSWTVSVDVNAGTLGGKVCNTVTLDGEAHEGTLSVIIGYTPNPDPTLPPTPIYATYTCAPAADDEANACVDVTPNLGLQNGDYCSFSQGGFGGSGYPFNLLSANFATMYPSGVEAGIPGIGGFSMKFTSAGAVQTYLPAGGPANALTADSVNPASTSAGQFGGQVLALKLNVALSDASVTNAGLGDLYYCPAVANSLTGSTARQILDAAEIALGGGALPAGFSYATLAGLAANLDLSFDGKSTTFEHCGVASAWAVANLSKTPCP